MASSSRRKSNAKGYVSPSFFVVVVAEALEDDGMFEIKGYVARNYEDFQGRSVILTDPNGEMWPMELKKSKGSVWLKKGWLEFANFYSLEQGCSIYFTYLGPYSGFQVRIHNKGKLEIEYPLKSRHHGVDAFTRAKRFRSSHHGADAFTRAKRFRSSHPYLAVKMQHSYLKWGLKINSAFANENICATGAKRNLELQNMDGKTWSGMCSVWLYKNNVNAKIHGGWTKFAAENELKVGDACVFELKEEHPELTFLVHIFRANEEIHGKGKQPRTNSTQEMKIEVQIDE